MHEQVICASAHMTFAVAGLYCSASVSIVHSYLSKLIDELLGAVAKYLVLTYATYINIVK